MNLTKLSLIPSFHMVDAAISHWVQIIGDVVGAKMVHISYLG